MKRLGDGAWGRDGRGESARGEGQYMTAALDGVIRGWLVVAAWIGLGRSTPRRMWRIARPERFVRAAIASSGGLVALAIALLPRRRRGEARIAWLSCKALVGFE